MSVKLEVGKRYVDTDGDTHFVMFDRRTLGYSGEYPFVSMYNDSCFFLSENGKSDYSSCVMVREYREPKVMECYINHYENTNSYNVHPCLKHAKTAVCPGGITYKAVLTEVME